ncbi:PREDICTED: uncharacterized protein LOC105454538 [Wasmannia auropunctata]|uniref:uncharacterized protein LOC105454538 n=1 Tax=Wasmannia auropunctata TaxID=64793 RepID=UPI0005F03AF4|nr:PREDICTED: uncharacterized protein LOC105454538 [Wasmannia auropunctata]
MLPRGLKYVPQTTGYDVIGRPYAKSSTKIEDDDADDEPIKFSTSKAAKMRIEEYRDPDGDSVPWYQGWSVIVSLAVFLGYFCILREENDVDLILGKDLQTTIQESMESMQKDLEKKHQIKMKTHRSE